MPTNNSGSVSFPGADGEPVIIAKEDFVPEHPVLLGEPKPKEVSEGDESPSVGNSSSPSATTNGNTTRSNARKNSSR